MVAAQGKGGCFPVHLGTTGCGPEPSVGFLAASCLTLPGASAQPRLRIRSGPETGEWTRGLRSPSVDEDGVLVQPVVHADLQVHVGPRHPDRHVDSNADGSEVQLNSNVETC